jgi:PmbA protein
MERFELSQDLGREILATAKAKGASAGDVVMAESESFFVTVRMGEVEKISQAGEKRLGLRLFFGQSSASASTSDISTGSIEKLVDDTVKMARATAQDPYSGLPPEEALARELPQLDLVDDAARAVSVDEKSISRWTPRKALSVSTHASPTLKERSFLISSGGSFT